MRPVHLLSALLLLVCLSATAAIPTMVKDLRTLPTSGGFGSGPEFLAMAGSRAIFAVRQPGWAIWATDGTAAGTLQLFALAEPTLENNLYAGLSSRGAGYISVRDASGWKLWKTDGTVSGTTAITAPNAADPPSPIATLNGAVLFLQKLNSELWIADGSGTRKLATIRTIGERWTWPAAFNGMIYIGTESGLWKTDGSQSGTTQIFPSEASMLAVSNNRLFFSGLATDSGRELWVTDGSAAGTHIVSDFRPGTDSLFGNTNGAIAPVGNGLFFIGLNGEVGFSDGTPSGTQVFFTGAQPGPYPPVRVVNGTVFFVFDDGKNGLTLWRSDGTAAGTAMVKDASGDLVHSINTLTPGATRVYFYGLDPQHHNIDLFESDGTPAGTHTVHSPGDPNWYGASFSVYTMLTSGDTVFFQGANALYGDEPWTSDGTAAGTHMVADIGPEAAGSGAPIGLVAGNGRLYFEALGDDGPFIWSSDGTAAGTNPLFSILAAQYNDLVPWTFAANSLFYRRLGELWASSGTNPAIALRSFNNDYPGPVTSSGLPNFTIGGRFYFIADDGSGFALWTSDGTVGGTTKVMPNLSNLTTLAGRQFFVRQTTVYSASLPSGVAAEIATPANAASLSPLVSAAGSLFLFTTQRDNSNSLWRLSGSPGDITLLKNFPSQSFPLSPQAASVGTMLIFSVHDPATAHTQLWRSDGTPDGTVMLKDVGLGQGSSFSEIAILGNRAVFPIDDGGPTGAEPWVTDGTPDGTQILRDINTGSAGSFPRSFVVADGIAYFAATDAQHGTEMWQTDGTPSGTQLVYDITPGPTGSYSGGAVRFGDALYFAASTPDAGTELWTFPLDTPPAITIDDARGSDGDAKVTMTVRLTRTPSQAVTVGYQTADATAKAGTDYVATSGTLTFAPGETSKTIDVPMITNAGASSVRSFAVVLHDANVPLERAAGFALIDHVGTADLSLSIGNGQFGTQVVIKNAGPSGASNVVLCMKEGVGASNLCLPPTVISAGATVNTSLPVFSATDDIFFASVTANERDPNPANNTLQAAFTGDSFSALFVHPATLRVGDTATVVLTGTPAGGAVSLTSSDPTVISVPNSIVGSAANLATGTVTALALGSTTLTTTQGSSTRAVSLHVVDNGKSFVTQFTLTPDLGANGWTFGGNDLLTATVNGIAANGASPGGTVTFFEDGDVIGVASMIQQKATFLAHPKPGDHSYYARYNGDDNFFPAILQHDVQLGVGQGTPTFTATRIFGTSNVRIVAHGVDGYPPTGTITVSEHETDTMRNVTGPLAPLGSDSSSTTALSVSPSSTTLTIVYSGDSLYRPTFPAVVIGGPHTQAARH